MPRNGEVVSASASLFRGSFFQTIPLQVLDRGYITTLCP
jgi:hypothetical protein